MVKDYQIPWSIAQLQLTATATVLGVCWFASCHSGNALQGINGSSWLRNGSAHYNVFLPECTSRPMKTHPNYYRYRGVTFWETYRGGDPRCFLLSSLYPHHKGYGSDKFLNHFGINEERSRSRRSCEPSICCLQCLEERIVGTDMRLRTEYNSPDVPSTRVKQVCVLVAILFASRTVLQRNKCEFDDGMFPVTTGMRQSCTSAVHAHGKLTKCRVSHSWLCFIAVLVSMCRSSDSTACLSKNRITAFPCLEYNSSQYMFELTCSFEWSNNTHNCIVLQANEFFEGHVNEINITGYNDWEGLFQIATATEGDAPSSLADAPAIRNVHIVGGQTSSTGGFVVQSQQNHFIVESCSSTGIVEGGGSGFGGGGICGFKCSGDILIRNCWSEGELRGNGVGGIAGRRLGFSGDGFTVNVTHCYSTGDIIGQWSGGICGNRAGQSGGDVTIANSYSTGKIEGERSGGICGSFTGYKNGNVTIERCYSLGEIHGAESGGITGSSTAHTNGHVTIANCYSRGDITGADHGGGICGSKTGGTELESSGDGSILILTNVYASGDIKDEHAGGLIGEVDSAAKEIKITMSVYNDSAGPMIDAGPAAKTSEKNSGDLNDIVGSVYCYYQDQQETSECWENKTIWQAVKDGFPLLQDMPIPLSLSRSASVPPTPTVSPSPSPSGTQSVTPSHTDTPTSPASPSETNTATPASTGSSTRSQTPTPLASHSPSKKPKRMQFTQLPVQRPCCRVVTRL